MSDASGHVAIVGKGNIRATYACAVGFLERQRQIAEPVRVRGCVIVKVSDNFSARDGQAQIPRMA